MFQFMSIASVDTTEKSLGPSSLASGVYTHLKDAPEPSLLQNKES